MLSAVLYVGGMNMTKDKKIYAKFISASVLLLSFVVLIVLIKTVSVEPIGPQGSEIGLSGINAFFKNVFSYNGVIDKLTDVFILISAVTAGFFVVLGTNELIKRKSLRKVDTDIFFLGATYAMMAAFFVLFEIIEVNYRPVVLDGNLEASFPSSHTMVVITVMGTAIDEIRRRVNSKERRNILIAVSSCVIAFTVIGRIVCGVHWFTDILGGALIASSLVLFFSASCDCIEA